MNAIIPDIDTLKKVVKINATLPDEAINPYIDDAMDIYLTLYIGIKTVEKALTGTDKRLNDKILRTLGPLTLMLATPELGIRIGDSGITVENKQGTYSPANEAKIAAAKESFYFRGMQALDRLLTFLTEHPETYPEYVEHCKQVRDSSPCFIRDAREFLSVGREDFVVLRERCYQMTHNSFLLHGYYNYRHLLLLRQEAAGQAKYYIGVPGNFYEREKQVARMFGFESFEGAREPAWEGDFGYYLISVEL